MTFFQGPIWGGVIVGGVALAALTVLVPAEPDAGLEVTSLTLRADGASEYTYTQTEAYLWEAEVYDSEGVIACFGRGVHDDAPGLVEWAEGCALKPGWTYLVTYEPLDADLAKVTVSGEVE